MGRRKKTGENEKKDPIYATGGEKVVELELSKLKTFDNHPFKVQDDDEMLLLMESISKNGIINPIIVIPKEEGFYQIVSGHRRKHCAEKLGLEKIPVIIRYMKEEDSIISMVDSNLQRTKISHSEKAFAYKMKNEALKRKASQSKKTMEGRVASAKKKRNVEILGEKAGDSPRQVTRYIRLTYLIPELLEKLDTGNLGFNPAVDLAFLSEQEQRWVLDVMECTQSSPTLAQTHRIKEMSRQDDMSYDDIKAVFEAEKQGDSTLITFSSEQLHKFFPKFYTAEEMKKEILNLLREIFG